MRSSGRYLVVVAALMAGSLLLVACGGDEEEGMPTPAAGTEQAVDEEELSLDEYFRQFNRINDDAQTRVQTLESEAVGQDLDASRNFYEGLVDIFEETFNDFKSLQPPTGVRDVHDEFVAAGAEMQASLEDLSEGLADVESLSELQALLAEPMPAFEVASERMNNACFQLQGIADESGIDVDLECGEEEEAATPAPAEPQQ